MSLGVIVRTRTAPSGRGAPRDTDTLFLAGPVNTADVLTEAVEVRSVGDFVAAFAARSTENAPTFDYLDNFFREGGRKAYVGGFDTVAGTVVQGLAMFPPDLGAGQVAMTGKTPTGTLYGNLLDHAEANNRFALLDVDNGDVTADMTTLAAAVPTSHNDYGALFGPWVTIPGPSGVIGGSERQVPGSSTVAALAARADALGNPNQAPAGRDFPLQYATSFVTDVTTADRETLLDAGVNTFADRFGVLQLYGFQTTIEQSEDTPFWQANCSRARMWLSTRAAAIGEGYMFKPIDGQGLLANALKHELTALCLELYAVNGLFGAVPEEAFAVEVGPSVNTIETVALGELHAVIEARLSLHAKTIIIELVSVPVNGTVSVQA